VHYKSAGPCKCSLRAGTGCLLRFACASAGRSVSPFVFVKFRVCWWVRKGPLLLHWHLHTLAEDLLTWLLDVQDAVALQLTGCIRVV
jgi:hypothetical protein